MTIGQIQVELGLRPCQEILPKTKVEEDIRANENIIVVNLVAAEPSGRPRGMNQRICELVPAANFYKQKEVLLEGEAVLHKLGTEGNRLVANLVTSRFDVAEKERLIDNQVKTGWLRGAIRDLDGQLGDKGLRDIPLFIHSCTKKNKVSGKSIHGHFLEEIKKSTNLSKII